MNKFISSALWIAIATSSFSVHAAAYKVSEVANGGSVSGKVTFSGDDPAPKVYAITKDQDTCGKNDRLIDYVKVNDGALQDAVVYLEKVKKGKAFTDNTKDGNLDQKGCEFFPYVQIMQNKGTLEVLNSDPVSHNIHTYEIIGKAKRTVLNISQPKQNSKIKKKIKLRRGTAMKIECDQHDFMHGYVFVAKNPYYAKVADDGSFTIDNVPAGKYTIKVWHGMLGEQKSKVTVEGGKATSANFNYK